MTGYATRLNSHHGSEIQYIHTDEHGIQGELDGIMHGVSPRRVSATQAFDAIAIPAPGNPQIAAFNDPLPDLSSGKINMTCSSNGFITEEGSSNTQCPLNTSHTKPLVAYLNTAPSDTPRGGDKHSRLLRRDHSRIKSCTSCRLHKVLLTP